MSRYAQLLELIDIHKPKSLIEIGVWNGANAIRMIKQALKHHDSVEYTGYDLFEDATPETDAKEFNVKAHNQVKAVAAYIRAETGVIPTLIKGDTNETLAHGIKADFVFLDGGHSVGTIGSDYSKLMYSNVVVLDDYYTSDDQGNAPDIRKYGCNKLLTQIANYKILPSKDPVKGGGFTQLAVICQQ